MSATVIVYLRLQEAREISPAVSPEQSRLSRQPGPTKLLFVRAIFPRLALLLLAPAWAALAQQNPAPSTPEADAAAAFNAAMRSFAQGNYREAAEGLSKVLATVSDPKAKARLGPAYYTLGSAYFNIPDYPKAVEIFKKYLEMYPNGERTLEVRLAIARASFLNKDYEPAIKLYQELEVIPPLREQALHMESLAYKELGRPDDQIRVLERLIGGEIKTAVQANAAVALAELYADKDAGKAAETLALLRPKTTLVENLIALNAVSVKTGDKLAEEREYQKAIAVYRTVLSRDEILKTQAARIAALGVQIEAGLKAVTADPRLLASVVQANNDLKARQAQDRQLLGKFATLPEFMPAILLRMGKCWYDWDKKWEAIVVFDRLLHRYPEAKEREPALFSKVVAYAELNQPARCQQLCADYLKEFPNGRNAATVGYLSGATALQAGDARGAIRLFGTMLENQAASEFTERVRFLLGNAKFSEGDYEGAVKDYEAYSAQYPTGQYSEEAGYRSALALLFQGQYENALGALNAYLKAHPNGEFVADAKYRVLVCKYSAQLYDEIVRDVQAWRSEFPTDPMTGEVLALLGDALAATGRTAEAIPAYVESYKKANTDEVLNYSLFEAGKLMQKEGQWNGVSRLFQEFIQNHPDHPSVVAAMYWTSRALAHEGKGEEARQILVGELKRYLNDPKREAVEQLLQQLAQLCLKRPRLPLPAPQAGASPVQVANGSATPATAASPSPPPYDPVAELDKQMAPLLEEANATGHARVLYAQAELATLRKKQVEHDRLIGEIAATYKPADLSPLLLAQVGDYLLAKGEKEQAGIFYSELKDYFPKSDYLDFAYVGLGEIAFGKKDYGTALELFTSGADDFAGSRIKEATIGKAKTLLELGRYEEARKLFEQIASVREWRGESTAYAVYSMGQIEEREGHWAEAIAHYQRVFVLYQRYLPLVAKAYINCAGSFEKLGKREEAASHLKEMLRNEKLQGFPETEQARQMLAQWGDAT